MQPPHPLPFNSNIKPGSKVRVIEIPDFPIGKNQPGTTKERNLQVGDILIAKSCVNYTRQEPIITYECVWPNGNKDLTRLYAWRVVLIDDEASKTTRKKCDCPSRTLLLSGCKCGGT